MSRDDEIAAALRPTFTREAAAIVLGIEEAAAAGRREDVQALAHRLIGTAGTVREAGIVIAARELEQVARDDGVDEAALLAHVRHVVDAVRVTVVAVDPAPEEGSAAGPVIAAGRPVVVAIEDDPTNLALLRRILAGIEGVELVTAGNGADGVRLARERSAALVLLDMNLPDVSGEWVLRALQESSESPGARVVVVSADASPHHEERARSLGASGYVAKPFDVTQLRAVVLEACGAVDSSRP